MAQHRETAAAAPARTVFHDSIGSTNAEALRLARTGEAGPLWIVAEEQTAGRGRRGRSWHSPRGNLHASLLLVAPCAPGRAAELSFVAALSLHDALAELAPVAREKLRLKWPNDVLLDDAKLAGILVEGETLPDGRFVAVIGFGVNCVARPPDTPYPATDLRDAGFAVTAQALHAALACAAAARLAQWAGDDSFESIRRDWTARAAGLGETVRIRLGDEETEGRFAAIDGDGRLVLALADGTRRTFSAGEVTAARRAPAEAAP